VPHFFQVNFELHPYDVEKWAESRWNHRQLKIGRRQLDLWHRLSWGSIAIFLYCPLQIERTADYFYESIRVCLFVCLFWLFLIARAIPQLHVSGGCHHYRWQGCKCRPILIAFTSRICATRDLRF
jgi:hypothetical protein